MESRLTTLETKWETVIPHLATKADLSDLESRLRSDMHKGFTEVNHRFSEVSQRFSEVAYRFAEIQRCIADLQKWVIGTVFTMVAVCASMVALGLNLSPSARGSSVGYGLAGSFSLEAWLEGALSSPSLAWQRHSELPFREDPALEWAAAPASCADFSGSGTPCL